MTDRLTTIMLERIGDEGWEWTAFCAEHDRLVVAGHARTLDLVMVSIRAEVEARDAEP